MRKIGTSSGRRTPCSPIRCLEFWHCHFPNSLQKADLSITTTRINCKERYLGEVLGQPFAEPILLV
jgi:hypothetical protein